MKLLLFSAVIHVCLSSTTRLDEEWEAWKSLYSKVYDDEATESARRLVWENNWRFVQRHNNEGHSFEVEMNKFADLVSLNFRYFTPAVACIIECMYQCIIAVYFITLNCLCA